MKPDWQQVDWRGVVFTSIALAAAWLSGIYSPRLLAWVGLADLELLGQLCAVVAVLTLAEILFSHPRLRSRTPDKAPSEI